MKIPDTSTKALQANATRRAKFHKDKHEDYIRANPTPTPNKFTKNNSKAP